MNLIIETYSCISDIICIIFCALIFFIKKATYINKTKKFKIIEFILILLVIASLSNLFFNILYFYDKITHISKFIYYILKYINYLSLLSIFICYTYYLDMLIQIKDIEQKNHNLWMGSFFIIYSIIICLSFVTKFGFYIDENSKIIEPIILNPFIIGYSCLGICTLIGLLKYRKNFIERVFNSIFTVTIISGSLFIVQLFFKTTSFTTITFLFPIIIIFYLFHSSSYEPDIGSLNFDSFKLYIDDLNDNRKNYGLIFLNSDLNLGNGLKKESRKILFNIYKKYFKKDFIFRVKNDLICFVYLSDWFNFDIKDDILEEFKKLHNIENLNFKLVNIVGRSKLYEVNEYIDFFNFLSKDIDNNVFYFSKKEDIEKYFKEKYIISQLKDICDKGDLDDERVLVYCQPIYDVKNGSFKSAEALMRLTLREIGIVLPNIFIPLAEKNGYIYSLTKIILNKTCKAISNFSKEGYVFDRISINFSMEDFLMDDFYDSVINIVSLYNIDFSKIAIELTESEATKNPCIKTKIEMLRKKGINFYLDDFGSGYSNFERILNLPVDIIKFDRSMVSLSSKSSNHKYMINNFADTFINMKYKILFEGVENENEEDLCKDMKADYLQGYKYSTPIPIDKLRNFFKKENE